MPQNNGDPWVVYGETGEEILAVLPDIPGLRPLVEHGKHREVLDLLITTKVALSQALLDAERVIKSSQGVVPRADVAARTTRDELTMVLRDVDLAIKLWQDYNMGLVQRLASQPANS